MESLKFLSSIITLVDILENLSTSQQWKSFFKFVFQSHRFLFLAADLHPFHALSSMLLKLFMRSEKRMKK